LSRSDMSLSWGRTIGRLMPVGIKRSRLAVRLVAEHS
jgi:hypothetical protein